MKNTYLPIEIIQYTRESILIDQSANKHLIYRLILVSIITGLLILPLIKLDVSVQASGIIRPVAEKSEIRSLVSGTVAEINITENAKITKDEPLVILKSAALEKKLMHLRYEISQIEMINHDLQMVTESKSFLYDTNLFKVPRLKSEYLYLQHQLKDVQQRKKKLKLEIQRHKKLYKKQAISSEKLENLNFDYSQLEVQHDLLFEESQSKWHKELLLSQIKKHELLSEIENISLKQAHHTIRAPVTGTVEQFKGIYNGSHIQSNQLVAVISPDQDLIAELLVSPKDIGLIKIGQNVNLQIDAFNYNQWGLLQGEVTQISSDYILSNGSPVFRIRCSVNKNYLMLDNGYKGFLKKGMSIHARLLINERSLWDVLFDKVNDWLNPTQKST